MSIKSKLKIESDSEDEQDVESVSSKSSDESNELDEPDEIDSEILDDKLSDNEYEPENPSSSDEEKSDIEEPDQEPEEEDDLFGVDEEDIYTQDDDAVEDAPVELEGEDEGHVFEDVRKKKPTNTKESKRRLFPFIQKKKRISQAEDRDIPEFHSIDIRDATTTFLQSMGLLEKEVGLFEKAIFNASVRANSGNDLTVDSLEFKQSYMNIVRYFMGAYGKLKKSEILQELKNDIHSSKSVLFTKAREIEHREQDKIKNPIDAQEDPEYPCPKCKGIKAFRHKTQMRSGDEGQSMLLWCSEKGCGHHWRKNS